MNGRVAAGAEYGGERYGQARGVDGQNLRESRMGGRAVCAAEREVWRARGAGE